jgi:RHS repeat-associated protein
MTEETVKYHSRGRHFRTIFAIVGSLIMLAVAFNVAVKPSIAAPIIDSEEEAEDAVQVVDVVSAVDEGSVNEVEVANPIQYDQSMGGSVESWGTITPTTSDAADAAEPSTLIQDGNLLTYRTAAGIYSIDADGPMYLSLADDSGTLLIKRSYFTIESQDVLLSPAMARITQLSSSHYAVIYGLVAAGTSSPMLAQLEVDIDFSNSLAPKITATVLDTADTLFNWRVVWILEPASDARMLLPSLQKYSSPMSYYSGENVPIKDLSVNVANWADDKATGKFKIDWSDAKEGSLSIRNVGSSLEQKNVMQVTFSEGKKVIDPTVVATSSSATPTGLSMQRKNVWYDGYHWVFYDTGSGIAYKRSADGRTWSSAYALPESTAVEPGFGFDVCARDGKIGVAWLDYGTNNAYFIGGTFMGPKIQWGARSIVTGLGACYAPISLTIGTDGAYDVFVQWRMIPGYLCFSVYRSFTGLSPWAMIGPALEYAYSNSNTWNVILPFGDGDLALVETSVDYSNVRVRYWLSEYGVSSGWTAPTEYAVAMATGSKADKFSAVATLDGIIHLAIKDSANKLKYCTIHPSGVLSQWVLTSTTILGYPTISIDENNDLHIFWLDSSTVIKHIQKIGPNYAEWSAIDTFYTSSTAMTWLNSWITPVGVHALVWTTGTSVMFGSIPLPYGTPGASAEPWSRDGLSPYGTYFSAFRDYVSPGSGMLTLLETDVSIPGRGIDLSIGRIYQEPKYFRTSDGQPYMPYAFPYSNLGPGWSLDLPWMDENYVYTGNGQRFIIQWGNNGVITEFENHDDIHFILRQVTKIAHGGAYQYYELITSSGMTYGFDYNDYKLTDIGELYGYEPEARDYTPKYNMVFLSYDVNDRLSSLEEYELGRVITFSYNANGMLQTITRPDTKTISFGYTSVGGQYRLTSVTDPLSRVTTFAYTAYGSTPYNYLLSSVQFPTGAKDVYTYAQDLSVGTEVRSWLVTQQKVADAVSGLLFRQTDYDYKIVSGKVRFVKATEKNEAGIAQGSTEYIFVSGLKYSSETIKDALGVQMSRQVTWYDAVGQPTRVDTYKGASQSATYSEYAGYDDWGNAIFTRNAMGYESYASFANTKTQNSFQGGSILTRTSSGSIYYDSFDDWDIADWPTILTGGNTVTLDGSADPSNAPAMKITQNVAGAAIAYQRFQQQTSDFIIQTRFMTSTGWPTYIEGHYGVNLDRRLCFFSWGGWFHWFDGTTHDIAEVPCVDNTWYDIAFSIHYATNSYDIYIDGQRVSLSNQPMLQGTSGYIDSVLFQAGDIGQFTTEWIDNVRIYKSLTVTVNVGIGYVAELYDAKDKKLDRSKSDGTRAILTIPAMPLSFPPGYIKISKIGEYDFQTAMMDVSGGDVYTMAPGLRSSNMPKTNIGFGKSWDIFANEGWGSGTVIDSGGDCSWVTDADYSVSGSLYHESRYSEGSHYHGTVSSGSETLGIYYTYVITQYIWLTEGKLPREVMMQFNIGGTWKRVFWGGDSSNSDLISVPGYAPATTLRLGDLPQTTGKWLQLTISAADLGISSGTVTTGMIIFGLYGGTARWDFTSVYSQGIYVDNVPSGYTVELTFDDGEYTSAVSTGAVTTILPLYADEKVLPASGYFRVLSGTTLVYESPWVPQIWNLDWFTYSAPKWYANEVKKGPTRGWIHDCMVGGLSYQNAAKTIPQETYIQYNSEGDEIQTKTNLGAGWAYTQSSYDLYGNQLQAGDESYRYLTIVYVSTDLYTYPQYTFKTMSGGGGGMYEKTDFTYDMNTGALLSSTDMAGRVTSYEYDALGRPTKVTNADNTYMTNAYDDVNNKVTVIDELNHKAVSYYDKLARMTKVERYGSGSTVYSDVEYTYNWQDKIASQTDELNHVTTYAYDCMGRLVRTTNPDTSYRTVTYDDLANIVTYTDELGHPVAQVFDDLGRLTATREYTSVSAYYETLMTYDAAGNLLTADDARVAYNQVTSMSYDSMNRLIQTTYPDGLSDYATYDNAGRVLTETDREGNVTTRTYDTPGNLASVTSPSDTITYTYNSMSQKTKAQNNLGSITYVYDSRGRTIRVYEDIGANSYPIKSGYDSVGNLLWVLYPDSKNVTYTYDAYDRVTTVKSGTSTIKTLTYNLDDSVATEVTGPSTSKKLTTTYAYDNRDRPSSMVIMQGTTTKLSLVYTYDTVGNVLTLVSTGGTETYTYDWLNRLKTAVGPYGSITYNYDEVGNRLSMIVGSTTTTYTYGSYNLLTGDGTWTYTYDVNLNQAWKIKSDNKEKWCYQWNALDQLSKVIKGTYKQGKWTFTDIGVYSYDANGARAKTVEGSTTIEYTFIGHDPMCEKTGTTYTDYVYINGKVSEKLVGTTIYHYFSDPMIGSTWRVWKDGATSATASVTCYVPFGTPYGASGTEKVKYAGEILDASTGLYYVFARYMDPNLGRFLSLDPKPGELNEPQSFNRHVYCLNNPLRIVDPTGEWGFKLPKISLKTIVKVAIIVVAVAATVATFGVGGPIAAIAIGAVIGATSSAACTAVEGGSLSDIAKSALIGGLAGAAGGAIGGGAAGSLIGKIAGKAGGYIDDASRLGQAFKSLKSVKINLKNTHLFPKLLRASSHDVPASVERSFGTFGGMVKGFGQGLLKGHPIQGMKNYLGLPIGEKIAGLEIGIARGGSYVEAMMAKSWDAAAGGGPEIKAALETGWKIIFPSWLRF